MPDFISPSESDKPEAPLYAPAEDVPAGVPADALPADDEDAAITEATTGETTPIADAASPVPLTADRALNIAFGAALLLTDAVKVAAQKLNEQAEFVQNNTPAVLDALEEKGKPIRQAVMEKLREAVGFTSGGDDDSGDVDGDGMPTTSGGADVSQELPTPIVGGGTAAPFVPPVTVPLSGGSAEAEISALERRVRELEQEVSKPLVVSAPAAEAQPNGQSNTLSAASNGEVGGETPAEYATYDFASDAPAALADSPYAVSETPEETTAEGESTPLEATKNGEDHPA